MIQEVPNASWISNNLWQGGTPPIGTELLAAGIDLLISCQCELQPLAGYWPGVVIHHCPLRDSYDPTDVEITNAYIASNVAAEAVNHGKNVLIHCAAGLNRSGLVMALTLKKVLDITGYQAKLIIQANRPGALFNEAFCRLIEKGDPP